MTTAQTRNPSVLLMRAVGACAIVLLVIIAILPH
jgi:hypothetical protein